MVDRVNLVDLLIVCGELERRSFENKKGGQLDRPAERRCNEQMLIESYINHRRFTKKL